MTYRQDLFTQVVNQLGSGKTQDELSKKMNELVQACRSTGKVGDLTLKIKVRPDKGDTGQYFLEDTVRLKLPEFERGKTLMFGTPEGNLQRTDPNQGELELKSVGSSAEPIKPIEEPTQTIKSV